MYVKTIKLNDRYCFIFRFWNKKDSSKYLTESGSDAFDHLCQMRQHETVYLTNEINMKRSFSMDILVRHSVNVLCGLPSDVFIFNKVNYTFMHSSTC